MKRDFKNLASPARSLYGPIPGKRRWRRWPALAILVAGGAVLTGLAPQDPAAEASPATSEAEPEAPVDRAYLSLRLEIPGVTPTRDADFENLPAPGAGPKDRAAAPQLTLSEAEPKQAASAEPEPAPPATAAPQPSAPSGPPAQPEHRVEEVTVASGDSLYGIFKRLGVRKGDLYRLLEAGDEAKQLARIRPGHRLRLTLDEERGVHSMVLVLGDTDAVHYRSTENGFEAERVHTPLERRVTSATATISESLFLAGQRSGLSDKLIMELVDVFGWDIDFALDIREGDRFTVIYEELFKDGERRGDGNILAAEFENRGRVVRAVRYVEPDGRVGYYTPDGQAMRKAFIRSPVKFSRISSRFSGGRRHPVLHKVRAHRGVDYAAPRGTAVRATGAGTVAFVGRKGGYGKTVVLRHGGSYTTLYAHLSRYARGLTGGKRVEQGQVIGFVGRTGMATGPHLHYEFRVNGVHRNPLTVRLPTASPIAQALLDDFRAHSAALLAELDLLTQTQLAANEQ